MNTLVLVAAGFVALGAVMALTVRRDGARRLGLMAVVALSVLGALWLARLGIARDGRTLAQELPRFCAGLLPAAVALLLRSKVR